MNTFSFHIASGGGCVVGALRRRRGARTDLFVVSLVGISLVGFISLGCSPSPSPTLRSTTADAGSSATASSTGTGGGVGDGTGGGNPGSVDALSAATALCAWEARCAPGEYIYTEQGTESINCVVLEAYVLSENGVTDTQLSTLLSLTRGPCPAEPGVFSSTPTASAATLSAALRGSLADGAGCVESIQCQSGRCNGEGGNCGTCLAVTAVEGDSCTSLVDCPVEMICVGAGAGPGGVPAGTCETLQAAGAACTEDDACVSGYCYNGACSNGAGLGDDCSSEHCSAAFGCDPASEQCVNVVVADVGQPCDGSTVLCNNGYCDGTTCQAYLPVGATCGSGVGVCANYCVPTGDASDGASTCQANPPASAVAACSP